MYLKTFCKAILSSALIKHSIECVPGLVYFINFTTHEIPVSFLLNEMGFACFKSKAKTSMISTFLCDMLNREPDHITAPSIKNSNGAEVLISLTACGSFSRVNCAIIKSGQTKILGILETAEESWDCRWLLLALVRCWGCRWLLKTAGESLHK